MSNDDLLDKRMTYHEFCDYLSSAWLVAEETTKIYPDRKFRLAFLSDLERRVENGKGWRWIDYDTFIEVVPIKDTKDHLLGDECWCNPRNVGEKDGKSVWSHNAKDGRL